MSKWIIWDAPNKRGRYLVTIETYFGRQVRQADRFEYPEGNWLWNVLPNETMSDEVIAWQKCPEPYEGE